MNTLRDINNRHAVGLMLALLEKRAAFLALGATTTIHQWDALALETKRKVLD